MSPSGSRHTDTASEHLYELETVPNFEGQLTPRDGHPDRKDVRPPLNDQTGKFPCYKPECKGVEFDRKCEWRYGIMLESSPGSFSTSRSTVAATKILTSSQQAYG